MAISSVLTPEKITGRQRPTVDGAQKFISGGNVLGNSVISSAANKIVGFQRTAAVRPAIPDVNSIISSISSNIINSVNNTVNTGATVVNRTVENKIQTVRTELFQVVKNIQNKIDNINNLTEQKTELVNYINQTNSQNKTELVNYINQTNIQNKNEIINEINTIDAKISSNKQELINYISKSNIENKNEIIELINQNKKDIINNKTEIINYINKTVLQSNVVKKVEQLDNIITQVKSDVSQAQITQTPQQNFGGITTQLREIVQNIRETANETVRRTVTNLTTEYRKKVQEVDSAKPTGILQKFIDAYNTAFGFAQFFSNRKNISKLKDNLNAVKESFTESFSTAKLLREVIIKIVKQLSNLPKATASGSGGFDIDVDIPGPKLKQSLPRSASRFGKIGKFAALGAGAVGAGVAGGAVVNALADTGQVQPVVGEPMIPGAIVDGFSAIVERFEKAVEKLAKGATGQKKSEAKSKPPSGGGSSQSPSSSPGSSPGAMPSGDMSDIKADSPEEKALIATIRTAEGTAGPGGYNKVYGGAIVPELTQMTLKELYEAAKLGGTDRLPQRLGGKVIPYAKDKHNSTASGAVQLMPGTLKTLVDSGKFTWDQPFSEEVQNQIILTLARGRGIDPTKPLTMKEVMVLRQEWAGLGRFYPEQGGNESEALRNYGKFLQQFKSQSSVSPNTGMGGPSVDPSQIAPEARSLLATSIAQPPPTQSSEPQVNILPMDMTGGQQSQGGGGLAPSPPPQQQGPSMPLLPSGNPDNFLVLYSKMVYNIVDG
jgi:muramidase (phage lysozyme)